MSWDQDYNVPHYVDLLIDLSGRNLLDILRDELKNKGLSVVSAEDVLLADGMYQDVRGTKVTLSDGRVFIPKLIEKYTENGNYGCDTYKWCLENETPEVKHVDGTLDAAEEIEDDGYYGGGCDDGGCGCGF